MKVVFIGTVEFSLQMLQVLLESDVEIVGVISGKSNEINSDFVDLKQICIDNQLAYFVTDDVNAKESIVWIENLMPDIIFCLGWSRLIKKKLLQIPSLGIIGYHPAELPKNRGRHPIIWALVLGLKKTASTFFFMDDGADSGDIISQHEVIILDKDDARTLYNKMISTAKKQLQEIICMLNSGQCIKTPQDHAKANLWRKRSNQDGKVDWRMGAKEIYNLVRGLTHPYVGAHFLIGNIEYKVWKVEALENHDYDNLEPGKIIELDSSDFPIVKCGSGCVKLLKVEPTPKLRVGGYL